MYDADVIQNYLTALKLILCSLIFSLKFLFLPWIFHYLYSFPGMLYSFPYVVFGLIYSAIYIWVSSVYSWLSRWFPFITVIFHYMNLPHFLIHSYTEWYLIFFKFLSIPFWGWNPGPYPSCMLGRHQTSEQYPNPILKLWQLWIKL